MPFQFPANPAPGQVFESLPGIAYKWNGTGWAPLSPTFWGGMTFTAPVLFPDGTVAAPGVAWANESSMGLRRVAANHVEYVMGGAAIVGFNATTFGVGPGVSSNFNAASFSGQARFSDGTIAAPGISWINDPDSGWLRDPANGNIGYYKDGAGLFSVTAAATYSYTPQHRFADGSGSAPGIAWTSATNTGFYRNPGSGEIEIIIGGASPVHIGPAILWTASNVTFNSSGPAAFNSTMSVSGVAQFYARPEMHAGLVIHGGTFDINGNVPINCGTINCGTLNASNSVRPAHYYVSGTEYHLYGTGSNIYMDMAPNWYWNYNRSNGDLSWNGGGGTWTFSSNGHFYAPKNFITSEDVNCRDLYASSNVHGRIIKAINGLEMDGAGYPYPKIRFSSDGWRLEYEASTGKFAFMTPGGFNTLRIDGNGDCWAGSSFYNPGRYHLTRDNGLYYTSTGHRSLYAIEGNPDHSWMTLRLQHEGGVWAGLQIYMSGQGGEYKLHASGRAEKSSGAGQWEGLSDIRLKRNVRDLEYGLKEVLALKPIIYELIDRKMYDDSEDPTVVGLAAQDAEVAMPRMVYRRPDKDLGEVLGVKPDYVQYAMVNAIKELSARLSALEMK